MVKKIFKKKYCRGFTIIEMLAYIAVLSIILVLIVISLTSLITSENRVNIEKNIETSASTVLERMTRDIRNAKSIDTAGSTLGTNPGVLSLNTTDVEGNPKMEAFYLDNNILKISENSTEAGVLTFSSSRVTELVFESLDRNNKRKRKRTRFKIGNLLFHSNIAWFLLKYDFSI